MDLKQRFAAHEHRLIESFAPRLRGCACLVIDAWPTQPLPNLPLSKVMVLPASCWPDERQGSSRAWPYATAAIDLVLWRYAHECWSLPESLLTETDRVLGAGGVLLILGFRPLGHWLCRLLDPGPCFSHQALRGLGAELTRLGFERQKGSTRMTRGFGLSLPLLTAELRSRVSPGAVLHPVSMDWHRLAPNGLSWPARRVA